MHDAQDIALSYGSAAVSEIRNLAMQAIWLIVAPISRRRCSACTILAVSLQQSSTYLKSSPKRYIPGISQYFARQAIQAHAELGDVFSNERACSICALGRCPPLSVWCLYGVACIARDSRARTQEVTIPSVERTALLQPSTARRNSTSHSELSAAATVHTVRTLNALSSQSRQTQCTMKLGSQLAKHS